MRFLVQLGWFESIENFEDLIVHIWKIYVFLWMLNWIYVLRKCGCYQPEYRLICDNVHMWNFDIGCIEKWNETY